MNNVYSSARQVPQFAGLLIVWSVLAGLILPWHAVNSQVPIWDGANFVENALKIVERFDVGFWEGLKGLYQVRGWRPISFPAFCVPFFVIAGGKIIPAVALSLTVAALLTATYAFRLLCVFVRVPWAIVGSLVVCTMPWFGKYTTSYMSEMLWLGMTLGWLFHLLEAFRTGNRRHFVLAGLWLGGMSTVRPIETALTCALPILVSLIAGMRKGLIDRRDLVLVCMLTGGAILTGWLWGTGAGSRTRWLTFTCLCVAIGYFARRIFIVRPLLASVLGGVIVGLAWFLPYFTVLYAWAYETSLGDLARLTDRRLAGVDIGAALQQTLSYYSPPVLAALLPLAVMASIGGGDGGEGAGSSKRFRVLGTGLAMFPVMFGLLLYTGTGDPRRIMAGMLVIVTGAVLVILAPGGMFPWLRRWLLGLLLAVLYVSTLANNLAFDFPVTARLSTLTQGMLPPAKDADRNVIVAEGLVRLLQHGYVAIHTHCYRAPQAHCTERGVPWFDPHAVNTLLQERRSKVRAHFTGAAIDFSKPDNIQGWLIAEGFDHVLVDELPLQPGLNTIDPYVTNTEGFVRLLAQLPPVLKEAGGIEFQGRRLHLLALTRNQDGR